MNRTPSAILSPLALLTLLPSLAAQGATPPRPEPWRLDAAIGTPRWLHVSGIQRTRFESINGQPRPNQPETDDQWFTRTSLRADVDFHPVSGTLEMMDSRAFGGKDTSFASTAFSNVTDFIQAHAKYDLGTAFAGKHRLLVGRYTMSLGSRRFVIRNVYRNTVNNFTGVDYLWTGEDGSTTRAFWTMPVNRRPTDTSALRDNRFEWDDQDQDLTFSGLFHSRPLGGGATLETYVYSKHQGAANKPYVDIFMPGMRIVRKERRGSFSGQAEFAYQFGKSQLRADGMNLDHAAYFAHASIGYTFDYECAATIRLAWDYATGDHDPNDGNNNRFDRLYGAPRFEYAPTGIYGLVQRSNFNTPELRLTFKPSPRSWVRLAYRNLRLASSRDQWIANGIVDTTGSSGKDVGNQFELRARYDFIPQNMYVECGGAYLAAGDFLDRAPNSRGGRDVRYAFVEMVWTF